MAGETYVQRYAGGFKNRPDVSTPADAAFLNAVESALLRLLGEDPAADEVGVWVPASNRFVFQKITNANVDAAAAIARSKLNFGAGLVDADIAPGAAIAKSKLNLAATLGQADMAAGNKITAGDMAAGPPPGPTDGDIWIAQNVAGTDGPYGCWMFRYESSIPDVYKWVFIGGAPAHARIEAYESTASAAAADLATVGPSITVARAGAYLCMFGARAGNDSAGKGAQMYLKVGAAVASHSVAVYTNDLGDYAGLTNHVAIVAAAGDLLKNQYSEIFDGGNAQFGGRYLTVTPLRVS